MRLHRVVSCVLGVPFVTRCTSWVSTFAHSQIVHLLSASATGPNALAIVCREQHVPIVHPISAQLARLASVEKAFRALRHVQLAGHRQVCRQGAALSERTLELLIDSFFVLTAQIVAIREVSAYILMPTGDSQVGSCRDHTCHQKQAKDQQKP